MKLVSRAAAAAFASAIVAAGAFSLAAEPPASAPAPLVSDTTGSGTRLKEIGHVKALTDFCRDAIDKSDRGIVILLDNDRKFGEIENELRIGDFDTSEITRNHAVTTIQQELTTLRAATVTGNGVMAQLRDQIKNASTPQQKAALLKYEEALDGALTRQKRLTDRIGRIQANLTHDESYNPGVQQQVQSNAAPSEPPPSRVSQDTSDRMAVFQSPDPTYDAIAKSGADEIRDQRIPVAHDEDQAADRMDDAFAGCY